MRCEYCRSIIEEGEYYYNIDGDIICRDCIEDYLEDFTAEHLERCEETETEDSFDDSL